MTRSFSARSMREQEPAIKKYIDLLLLRLHEHGDGGNKALDRMSWYIYTTFDVIGDLAFGESFGCLDNSAYHPWVKVIFDLAAFGMVFTCLAHYPMVKSVFDKMLAMILESVMAEQMVHEELTKAT